MAQNGSKKEEEKWYKHKFNLLLRPAREGTLLGLHICVESFDVESFDVESFVVESFVVESFVVESFDVENFDIEKRRGQYSQKELTEVAIVELIKGRSF